MNRVRLGAVLEWAGQSKGSDTAGEGVGFIDLVQKARELPEGQPLEDAITLAAPSRVEPIARAFAKARALFSITNTL